MPRQRKPTHLKLVQGSAAEHPARLNPKEPKLKRGRPKPTKGITDGARLLWDEFCDTIEAHGVLSESHGRQVTEICETQALILDLRAQIEIDGTVVEEVNMHGDPRSKIHPAVPALLSAQRNLYMMLVQFGLTPSAAGKVSELDGDAKKGKGDFFD